MSKKNKIIFILKNKYNLILLVCISILSFFLNFYNISSYGYGNEYYAAAIYSMTQNFKNFFFVAFDPSGMVSIDKPPIGFWIQAISVLLFGYNGFAMLLPQAIGGTASCIMIYILISKYFGKEAGLLSAFVLSFTPAMVAASRNNTVDTQLIFVLLLATWFLFKSIEESKFKFLLIAGFLIGIVFNIKMLQAYIVVPAFAIVYLIFAKYKLSKKLVHGLITCILMICVSLSWALIVDFYPADSRPYVDSSETNSEIELIFGHNGMERLSGNSSSSMLRNNSVSKNDSPNVDSKPDMKKDTPNLNNSEKKSMSSKIDNPDDKLQNKDSSKQNSPNNGVKNNSGGRDSISDPSILRLWSDELYGQISWLIIFCIFSIIIMVKKFNKYDLNMKNVSCYFWSIWFITMLIFFSFAGYFHRYYLCMISPAIAALFGIGLMEMIKYFNLKGRFKQYILPLSFILTLIVQCLYISKYENLKTWMIPLIVIAGLISSIFMFSFKFKRNIFSIYASCIFLLISLCTAPFYWSLTTLKYIPPFTKPYCGPELASQNNAKNNPENSNSSDDLQNYLVSNYKEGSFLVVANRSNDVAQYIINTGLPAYAYGGFMGSDNSLTIDKLKQYVSEGKITYFMLSDGGNNKGNSSQISDYVKEHGTLIDSSEYNSKSVKSNLYLLNKE